MNLIAFLKLNKDTRKIFGEQELKIIEKQLLGINLTQSEKNRLSRDIRKKFDFIKESSKFSEEFEIKKGGIINERIEDSKQVILEDELFNRIKRIILYGSIIKKELTLRSDIDIAIEFDKIDLKEATLFRKRVLGRVNEKMDIQVYNILPEKLKKEINNGRTLYEK